MLRKGRKSNGNVVVGEGGASLKSTPRDALSRQPLTTLSPAANRANQIYQCYDMSVVGPSNATIMPPSSVSGPGRQRHSGVGGAAPAVAGSVAGKSTRTKRGTTVANFTITQRYNSAQATTPTRPSKVQQLSSNGTRTPPPPAPPPIARGGDSYLNENKRLVVSDPIPYTSRTQQKDRDGSDDSNGYTTTCVAKSNDAMPHGLRTVGRPRAFSLPRASGEMKDILPRLRPLCEGSNSGEVSGLRNASSRPLTENQGAAGTVTLAGFHTMMANDTVYEPLTEGESQREVLSAPPMSSTIIPPSHSPRPVADQLRIAGRHNKRGGAPRNNETAIGQAPGADPRIPHPLWANGNGGSDNAGLASAGGTYASGTAVAAAYGPGNRRAAPNGTRRSVKGGAGAAVAAAVAQRQVTALDRVDTGGVDAKNGTEVRGALYKAGSEHQGYSAREMRDETVRSDELFGSTQVLFSLLSGAEGGSSTATGARPAPPPAPASAPSARTPNRSNSGPLCAENELPVYKFNVVLSSGKTATIPISLIAGSGCVQGIRPTMEDAHFAELNATHVRGQPISLLAVLDGHCGRRVADLGAKWLPHYLLHHAALGENNALALVESILQTDREIFHTLQAKKSELQRHRKAGGGNSGRRRREMHEEMFEEMTNGANGGSTLIAAAVCGRMLYVACLGDARAVLYDGHTTIAMSEDHKPGNTDESRRIAKCGGFVQFGRVCGILAVSRALGDFEFKFQPSSASSSRDMKSEEKLSTDFPFGTIRDGDAGGLPGIPTLSQNCRFISNRDLMVSNIADVRQLHLTDASAFLLLACDGLWDVLSNEEATEFVRDFLCYTPDVCDPRITSGLKPRPSPEVVQRVLNNCCQKLAEFAVDRGSMDNVSVMVLFFHDVVDTVARFNGQIPSSARTSDSTRRPARQSNALPGSIVAQPRNSTSSSFELTNNQLKVRNGRVVAQR